MAKGSHNYSSAAKLVSYYGPLFSSAPTEAEEREGL